MRVSNISNYGLKPVQKPVLRQNTPSFGGISRDFKRVVYPHPETLLKIATLAKKDVIGDFPQDFVKTIETNFPKNERRKRIEDSLATFRKAAKALRRAEDAAYGELEFDRAVMEFMLKEECENAVWTLKSNFSLELAPEYEINYATEEAGKILSEGLKKSGVIPDGGEVEVWYMKSGMFGHAFRLEFKDKKGEKIYHDKVLKLYKDQKYDKDLIKRLSRSTAYLADRENPDYFEKRYREIFSDFSSCHGLYAEANRALFIKNKTGNMAQTNYAEPWIFDLKAGYALIEMADRELPEIKKKIKIEQMGLSHHDLANANVVDSRVVDYGGIVLKR